MDEDRWHTRFEDDDEPQHLEAVVVAGPGQPGAPANGLEEIDFLLLKANVLKYRRMNWSYDEIAHTTGYTRSGVRRLIKRIMREVLVEAGAEEIRAIELARIEDIMQRIWPSVFPPISEDPNVSTPIPNAKDVDTYLRLSKAKRELVGADAPIKIALPTYGENEDDEQIGSKALEKAERLERLAYLADKIVTAGIGSGREQKDADEDEDVVDAVLVASDPNDIDPDADFSPESEEVVPPGHWEAGKFVADE